MTRDWAAEWSQEQAVLDGIAATYSVGVGEEDECP